VVSNIKLTPLKAIRLKCLDCCAQQYKEVKLCPDLYCDFYLYRFGKKPTEDERKALKTALAQQEQ